MIGGIDIPLPTRAGRASLEVAVRAIRQRWPRAEFEDALSGERFEHFLQIPFGEIEELFVYRDRAAADAWDEQGAVPSVANTMIHLISDPDAMTVVVDERDAAMNEVVQAIKSGLEDQILCIQAEVEAT
jgi:hypothetical protein